jgi:hypothetical protein
MCVIFRGVFNIVCCVFDNSVVFNDTFIRVRWFVRSLIHSRSRSIKGRARWTLVHLVVGVVRGINRKKDRYVSSPRVIELNELLIVPSSLGDWAVRRRVTARRPGLFSRHILFIINLWCK